MIVVYHKKSLTPYTCPTTPCHPRTGTEHPERRDNALNWRGGSDATRPPERPGRSATRASIGDWFGAGAYRDPSRNHRTKAGQALRRLGGGSGGDVRLPRPQRSRQIDHHFHPLHSSSAHVRIGHGRQRTGRASPTVRHDVRVGWHPAGIEPGNMTLRATCTSTVWV